jgi:hypothetical protein
VTAELEHCRDLLVSYKNNEIRQAGIGHAFPTAVPIAQGNGSTTRLPKKFTPWTINLP